MNGRPGVERVISIFAGHLSYFERTPPLNRPEQLTTHIRAITPRRKFGTVAAALADNEFLDDVADTLQAWLGRDAIVVQPPEFRLQLRRQSGEITALDGMVIDKADAAKADRVWRIIRSLDIVFSRQTGRPTQSKIVGGTKALHHVLPELIPPVDRKYTGFFLNRTESYHYQNPVQETETFRLAFESFRVIASSVSPVQYVGRHPWNTSRTKVIDNGIVGFVRRLFDYASKTPIR